jgi:dihydrofolate synthase/folylpolyglutamate synthase
MGGIMTYKETLDYLYKCTPAFHQVGTFAYKPGLERSIALDREMGMPHRSYRTIHVAGTNGKGSVAHLLAAILRESKYKVGLYTSPHLVDFCERIRVNGKKIPEKYVVDFVERYEFEIKSLNPSFFEITSSLAFEYFRHKKVDFAIIETGLGGRLDSTNIIEPALSIITNVSMDHMQYLGNTLMQIASEKAGIIKQNAPVVIGEVKNEEIQQIFLNKAKAMNAPIYFAEEERTIYNAKLQSSGKWEYSTTDYGNFTGELGGLAQRQNTQTILTALRILKQMRVKVTQKAVQKAFEHVTELTGLMGRWQTLQKSPLVICDTGHNIGAWEYLAKQLNERAKKHANLRMIIGMVNDKDIDKVLSVMPKKAVYYFTQASGERALSGRKMAEKALQYQLEGNPYSSVAQAVKAALADADPNDLIFIGGSTFVVGEAIPLFIETT